MGMEEGDEGCGLEWWIKRDDLSSFDLSGNKVRKLQFLLADALEKGADSVITIGGIQSNHARATACAARQLGLEPHLILRTRGSAIDDPATIGESLVGNLLFDRMVDARVHTVTTMQYATIGSKALTMQLEQQLLDQGKRPYVIPVGGSCALGAFGYIDCCFELLAQTEMRFDHLVFACGSGGTAAGLAIGSKLAGLATKIHAIGVCDNAEYFFDHVEETARELGVDFASFGPVRSWLNIYEGQGQGYGRSTEEELAFLLSVSKQTGILLDPVYSGKGLYHFVEKVLKRKRQGENVFRSGQKVLFLHTGGSVGLYDKATELAKMLDPSTMQPMSVVRPV